MITGNWFVTKQHMKTNRSQREINVSYGEDTLKQFEI